MEKNEEILQTQTLSTFLASSLNVELVHIILKGIKKFSNVRLEEDEEFDELETEDQNARREREAYEMMRICRLNRIKIKNPQKWDKA